MLVDAATRSFEFENTQVHWQLGCINSSDNSVSSLQHYCTLDRIDCQLRVQEVAVCSIGSHVIAAVDEYVKMNAGRLATCWCKLVKST
jgi:iron only hydrogenase large subunit-like protein